MRIAFTDGEMSNLSADYGQLLCAALCEYKATTPYYSNIQLFTLKDYRGKRWDDRSLALEWRNALEEYDIVVTWNGIKFDIPFLNTRLRRWGLREVRIARTKDLLYTARYKLKLSSNSLDSVSRFLGVQARKTRLDPERWTMAMEGHEPSYRYILDHCKRDVKVLAQVWEKTKHLVTEIK